MAAIPPSQRPPVSPLPLPGFPGYRTQPDRSGYDYIDTQLELAHMEGLFYRCLFTGRLTTRNPFYRALLLICGLLLWLPFMCSLSLALEGSLNSMCISVPMLIVGIAFFNNYFRSLGSEEGDEELEEDETSEGELYEEYPEDEAVD